MRAFLAVLFGAALVLAGCRGGTTINNYTLPPQGAPSPKPTATPTPTPSPTPASGDSHHH
jgi:hypothetical protein